MDSEEGTGRGRTALLLIGAENGRRFCAPRRKKVSGTNGMKLSRMFFAPQPVAENVARLIEGRIPFGTALDRTRLEAARTFWNQTQSQLGGAIGRVGQRTASMKLIRATGTLCRRAASSMTTRTRL
jgi:hypothetical protein